MIKSSHRCPVCYGSAGKNAFPYKTLYNNRVFVYRKCLNCGAVFVEPIPDAQTFEMMYAKAAYHDSHYASDRDHYDTSAALLRHYVPENSTILDYGCGVGLFLRALRRHGMNPTGVEFDDEAARHASTVQNEEVYSVEEYESWHSVPIFDAVHLGDVLEHLPDPLSTFSKILDKLKDGGIVFVEGPLERNPSLVYWSANLYGFIKTIIAKSSIGSGAPTHLFRVDARQQQLFFSRFPTLKLLYWEVEETGWPYASGGFVKRQIAKLARRMGGRKIFGITFGNRFRGIYQFCRDDCGPLPLERGWDV